MADRPNVLWIVSDEHDAAVTGCYGGDVATPNLDRLARRGVTFENCYTPSPLCGPSRLSLTAGQYVSRHGGWGNNCWLPSDDYPATLPRVLAEAGYKPLLGGKMHYDATRRYGFEELFESEHNEAHKTGTEPRRDPEDPSVFEESWNERAANFYVGEDSYIHDRDRTVTDGCSEFLRNRDPDDDPFFLLAGYLAPHFPLVAPFEKYERYHGEVPPPTLPDQERPRNLVQQRRAFGVEGVDQEDDQVRFARELYWALVDWFDDRVGELLDALADSAVAENTVVVYTSDHGENKGDHGLWWKNCMYDHAARVPLIVSWPGRWDGGERRTEVCSLLDLVATFADIGGAEVPERWDGDSLAGVLDGEDGWKDYAVSEYHAHATVSGMTMFREGRYKYVYHAPAGDHGPERELYDLHADPDEAENLAGDADYAGVVERLHGRLVEELGRHPDEIEREAAADIQEPYDRG